MDQFHSLKFFEKCFAQDGETIVENADEDLKILHALRLAVIMKMLVIATELPAISEDETSRLTVLQKLQTFQLERIISDLQEKYPATAEPLAWIDQLQVQTSTPQSRIGGFPHISETIVKPLTRAADQTRQISIAITHRFDAFG